MKKNAVNTIGFWSALLAFIFSNAFTVGALVGGMLPKPWDAILPVAPSLLLAPTFAIMMAAVYHAAPEDRKIWGLIALVIAILYAAIASIVYVTWLFVLEPHVMQGTEAVFRHLPSDRVRSSRCWMGWPISIPAWQLFLLRRYF